MGHPLSGGGELDGKPLVAIFLNEPTRGIDVGAKVDVYHVINRLTSRGCAVILVSSEMPELLGMSDQVMVLHAGEVCDFVAFACLMLTRILGPNPWFAVS